MNGARIALSLLCAVGPLAFAWWIRRRVGEQQPLSTRYFYLTLGAGALVAVATVYLESFILDLADLSLTATRGNERTAALSMLLVVAPLEEAAKVLVLWPLYWSRRLFSPALGATYALFVASGFAGAELLTLSFQEGADWLFLLRSLLAMPAHLFFAGLWGYMLGGGRRDRFFGITWLGATVVHGIYDHIVFGRPPGFLVIAIPMFATMAMGVLVLLREGTPSSTGRSTNYSFFEPPSLTSMRDVWDRKGHSLMIHWIVIGAFVNLGVTLVFLGAAVYLGHRYGIDFALADEPGIEGIVPVALLGASLLASFPFSAYLIARASGTRSVLEPAWATGAAIIVVLFLFSVTEPTALVIAVGIAPVGFLLACAGAWVGLNRR